MPAHNISMKRLTIGCFFVVILTSLVSLAFFDAKPIIILRNDIVATLVFILVYYVWIKITENYEKSFRLGLGR